MNTELLQELLGNVDPTKNDMEIFLNQPFNLVREEMPNEHGVLTLNTEKHHHEVDLDRTDVIQDQAANEKAEETCKPATDEAVPVEDNLLQLYTFLLG